MLSVIPEHYDDTYKWFNKEWKSRFSFGMKEIGVISVDKVSHYTVLSGQPHISGLPQINKLARDQVESKLIFAGFLVFHCPLSLMPSKH